jgi:hypothetical protein
MTSRLKGPRRPGCRRRKVDVKVTQDAAGDAMERSRQARGEANDVDDARPAAACPCDLDPGMVLCHCHKHPLSLCDSLSE